jgi:hypothetical protein
MPTDSQIPENNTTENHHFFEFKNEALLLPEHIETDPADDFLAYGTSDDDLQF